MSIQIGANNILTNPRNRIFTNERLKLFSDTQSNLLEISSTCNEATLLLNNIQIGSSNDGSNIVIKSLLYDETNNKIIDFSKELSTINSALFNFGGSVTISSNITITGNIINNQPIQTPSVICSNIQLYSIPTNNVPLNISSNNVNIVYLNTASNIFVSLPNIGIGTTITNNKLQVQGAIYTSDGVYGSFISSNSTLNPTVQVYGNLNIYGSLSTTQTYNPTNTNINLSGININNTNYDTYPAIVVTQQGGSYPLTVINKSNIDNTSNTVFGISASGRTYIGVDLNDQIAINLYENSSQLNAMLTISLPYGYSNDNLLKAVSYNRSNVAIISSNAYIGIGTTIVNHPLHFHMQSNTNMLNNSLSNAATIGIYHSNMPNKYIMLATSNSYPVFSVDGSGSVSIGSNTAIYLGSNGYVTTNTVTTSNIVLYNTLTVTSNVSFIGFGLIQGSNIFAYSNVLTSNLVTSNITNYANISTSNLITNTINSTNNAIFNNVYIGGTLSGNNLSPFLGQSDSSYFSPTASNNGSVAHFKSSNVLISINSNYSAELAGAIAGNSNGVLQIRTYGIPNNPISAGVSVYGYDYSSMLVTANRPYYQLQRTNGNTFNIGINNTNELFFGISNVQATDYTTTYLKIASNVVTIGNSKTLMYVNSNGSILVAASPAVNTPLLTDTGGFEVIGPTYIRTTSGVGALYVSGNNGNVGIGNGNNEPKKTLDITGTMAVSGYLGIGTTIPLYSLHVQENAYYNNSIGIGTTARKTLDVIGDIIVSRNIGIGTTLPKAPLDVLGNMLVSGNIGIGTTQINSYGLYTTGNAYISGSLTVTNNVTALNIYGNLRGVANSAEVSSNALGLTGTPNISVGTIVSSNINTNNNNINVGIGTIYASSLIGSNIIANSISTINGTITGQFYTSNLVLTGSNTIINTYLTVNSNVAIRNLTGSGPALAVYQSGSGSNYHVADFYDNTVSTTIPVLRIADGGNIGIGTTIPIAKLHVQGNGYYSSNLGIGTTLPVQSLHVQGISYVSGNIGIGTTIPLARLHLNGNIISPVFTGLVAHFATSNLPTGWLKCNGASVSRDTYSALFNVIGTTYGVGIGTTSFQVPDLRGVFIRGWADDNATVTPTTLYDSWKEVATTTINSAIITALTDPATSYIEVGWIVTSSVAGVIPTGTTIVSISTTSAVMSANATATNSTQTLIFTRPFNGNIQADAIRQHTHDIWKTNNFNFSYTGGDTKRDYAASDPFIVSSGVAPLTGGLETRPVNMALLACIKY